jgi:hypothetical protein
MVGEISLRSCISSNDLMLGGLVINSTCKDERNSGNHDITDVKYVCLAEV